MINGKNSSGYGKHAYKHRKKGSFFLVISLVLIFAVSIPVISRLKKTISNEKRELLRVWSTEDYSQVFEISKNALSARPMDYFLLTINGFSAYQLGISQINKHNTLVYINECITSLRKALMLKESYDDGRVCYVLGKAYSYKGDEYAELAIKYLETAKGLLYDAQDIPEYLGIAYAASGEYRGSVEAFSQAFVSERQPSDTLLLSIARSYISMEEYSMAKSYLQRCVDSSPDSKSVVFARFLLADIFKLSGDYDGAESQYTAIMNEAGENAEVHFQLGELHNLRGDATKARSEWRIAYRQDPSHAKAKARLNI
ncbi:MAG: tetratricopeptide repeat protein [Treponema sp.]|jgi:tetratricopeptide (TPR) repeat protein|nr:tetratricopeptide repeat protein [Treponema sp.]